MQILLNISFGKIKCFHLCMEIVKLLHILFAMCSRKSLISFLCPGKYLSKIWNKRIFLLHINFDFSSLFASLSRTYYAIHHLYIIICKIENLKDFFFLDISLYVCLCGEDEKYKGKIETSLSNRFKCSHIHVFIVIA